jgi:anthranilate synthase component I
MTDGPLTTPVDLAPATLLALHAANPARYPALFESAATGPRGRFDILFAFPEARLTLRHDGTLFSDRGDDPGGSFLDALDRWWSAHRLDSTESDLPFRGGWLLYLGYEFAEQIEPRLKLPRAPGPDAQAIRIPAAIVCEHETSRAWIVMEAGREELAEQIAADIRACPPLPAGPARFLRSAMEEDAPQQYLSAVRRALEYIRAGDTYQANLSRGWYAELDRDVAPYQLYRRLRETNPGPFCALAALEGLSIVSSSPERLVEVRDCWIATRPIAGTRPRGSSTVLDRDLARELHSHPKERAEHIMLIDLERNDLGRVCEAGTVVVDELMTIESYAHVHHIVSNVRGRLAGGVTPGQILRAVFPGGTITGCPKVRCMEIIAELEARPRGAYTGSLGYLNRDGSMDMNILIRSLDIRGDRLALRAGAGIVADSIPERELEETRAKARGVLRALMSEWGGA